MCFCSATATSRSWGNKQPTAYPPRSGKKWQNWARGEDSRLDRPTTSSTPLAAFPLLVPVQAFPSSVGAGRWGRENDSGENVATSSSGADGRHFLCTEEPG